MALYEHIETGQLRAIKTFPFVRKTEGNQKAGTCFRSETVQAQESTIDNFRIAINEFKLVMKCQHPNVIRVEAICIDENMDVLLMFEYAEHGDLTSFVEKNIAVIKTNNALKLRILR